LPLLGILGHEAYHVNTGDVPQGTTLAGYVGLEEISELGFANSNADKAKIMPKSSQPDKSRSQDQTFKA
jgi:hypothetical protein